MAAESMQILTQAEEYVSDMYNHHAQLPYHNLEHTRNVVEKINEIASHYPLSEEETTAINVAAWFHDTGHLFTTPSGHEEKSVEIALEWMEKTPGCEQIKQEVKDLILSTKLAEEPSNISQEIIKDADTFHFGTREFKTTDKLLRKEMKTRNLTTLLIDWKANTLALLKRQKFYTDYCQKKLDEGKEKNIKKLEKKMGGMNGKSRYKSLLLSENGDGDSSKPSSYITKGLQTMLRLTSENHMRLSDMADTKANILISVNSIIISVILSVLLRKIEVDTHLTIPTFIFLGFSLITIVTAILATRPKITKGRFNRQEVLERKTNLLFFGNFYKTSLDEYKWGMSTMMKDPEYIYGSLIDDVYYLGRVLGRKYKLISISYMIFMMGIIISVLAFTIAIFTHDTSQTTVITPGAGSPF